MATLKDIAAVCGTSIATVSYVLSGRGDERRISAGMQERVVKTAEELGYDLSARARKTKRPTVAVYWPQRLNSMLPSFIAGMNAALSVAPIGADVSIHPFETGRLSEQSSLWLPGRAGTSVIVSASEEDLEALRKRKTTYPAVLLNRSVPGYSSVRIDEDEAGQMAVEYAIACAGSDVSMVVPGQWLVGAQYRRRSMQETCVRCGLTLRNTYACGIEIDDGYALGQKLLLDGKLSKALICVYDTVAIGLEQAFREAGMQPGRDVELITMSMSYNSSNTRLYQNMTVVDLRQTEVSVRGINMAIELAVRAGKDTRQIVVHPALIPHR